MKNSMGVYSEGFQKSLLVLDMAQCVYREHALLGELVFFRICWCTRLVQVYLARELKLLLCLPIVLLDQLPKFWENEVAKYGCS